MILKDIVRPNIYNLESYRCARDDFSEGILLDANENTHGPAVSGLTASEIGLELNRYPDPHQIELKTAISKFRGGGLTAANLYLGVGSDEAIDSLIRVVCKPGVEKLLTCPPTYGMYSVSANINDVEIVKVPLDLDTFDIRPDAILETLNADKNIKLVYICSPGNPTGKLASRDKIVQILQGWTRGIVVVDEAYIDFTEGMPSVAPLVNEYPRLAVLQTLSKSFGLAGLRLGMCFAHPELARILNAMKAPYNISSTTSAVGLRALSDASITLMKEHVSLIKAERARMIDELLKVPGIGQNIGGLDANFLLVNVLNNDGKPSNERASEIYSVMASDRKVVVRFRGKELGCQGGLRISIGTPEENTRVLEELTDLLSK